MQCIIMEKHSNQIIFMLNFFISYLKIKVQCLGIDSESKIVNEYDQEIPQSQTADEPMAA